MIKTERLILEQKDANHWLIFEQGNKQVLLGMIALLRDFFSVELIPASRGLGVAQEAAIAWLRNNRFKQLKAHRPKQPQSLKFLKAIGFVEDGDVMYWKTQPIESQYIKLNLKFGINITQLKTPYQNSACRLVEAERDIFDRPTKLHPDAQKAWQNMRQQAAEQGHNLQLVSAYRSPLYQAAIIDKKLQAGEQLSDILAINAAPGHSEHHSGCAIDLTDGNGQPLEPEFDQSEAFSWLEQYAAHYHFHLSYPKDNRQGIIYEPWHWCYHKPKN